MDYDLNAKKEKLNKDKNIPDKKYARRVYTNTEIQEILKDYIEIQRNKFEGLKVGNTRVCYIRSDDNSFCRGGYVNVNPIIKKETGEYFLQLRGNVRKSAKGNVVWMIPYSGISRLWMFISPELEYSREEIRKSERRQRAELSNIITKISDHLVKIKKDIRILKKEMKELQALNKNEDDATSVLSDKTNFTTFTDLKIYQDDSD